MDIDNLEMYDYSKFTVNSTTPELNLRFRDGIHIEQYATLDFGSIYFVKLNCTMQDDVVQFGNIIYRHSLGIYGKQLRIAGNIGLPEERINMTKYEIGQSELAITAENIEFTRFADVKAGHMMFQANKTISTYSGVQLASYRQWTCNVDDEESRYNHLFSCVPPNALTLSSESWNHDDFINTFNDQFESNMTSLENSVSALMKNFTIQIIAFEKIDLYGSQITGPRISLCAPEIIVDNSDIDAEGKGCQPEKGIGKGHSPEYASCQASGGAHGGYGGFGGSISKDNEQCKQLVSEPYYY